MLKAIIIDDEPYCCETIATLLEDNQEVEIVSICHSATDALIAIKKYSPDLVFLDVEMPKMNGFEMLELLEEKPCVIFTTAFDKYAIRAFEAHAVDYRLKPFTKKRFNKALEKCFTQAPVLKKNTKGLF